jgi:hypothetical protein
MVRTGIVSVRSNSKLRTKSKVQLMAAYSFHHPNMFDTNNLPFKNIPSFFHPSSFHSTNDHVLSTSKGHAAVDPLLGSGTPGIPLALRQRDAMSNCKSAVSWYKYVRHIEKSQIGKGTLREKYNNIVRCLRLSVRP